MTDKAAGSKDEIARAAHAQMVHDTFGTAPMPPDLVRQAVRDALAGVQYRDMDAERLADHIATVLKFHGVVSDERSYAGGLRAGVLGLQGVRWPL